MDLSSTEHSYVYKCHESFECNCNEAVLCIITAHFLVLLLTFSTSCIISSYNKWNVFVSKFWPFFTHSNCNHLLVNFFSCIWNFRSNRLIYCFLFNLTSKIVDVCILIRISKAFVYEVWSLFFNSHPIILSSGKST